jgi:hypothetical protein
MSDAVVTEPTRQEWEFVRGVEGGDLIALGERTVCRK